LDESLVASKGRTIKQFVEAEFACVAMGMMMTWCHRGPLRQITKRNFIRRRGVDVAIQRREQRADDDGIEGDPVLTVGGEARVVLSRSWEGG
jgi:hypothetical protein